jgi:hypothetical protein
MDSRKRNSLIPVSSHSRKRPQKVVVAKKSAGEVDGRINHPLRLQSKEVGATVASSPATSIRTESPINS